MIAWGFQLKIGDLIDVAAVDEDQVVLLGDKSLVLLRRGDDGWIKVARVRVTGGSRVLVSGKGLITVFAASAPPLVVYALENDKLRKVASSDTSVEDTRLVGEKVYAVCANGRGLLLSG